MKRIFLFAVFVMTLAASVSLVSCNVTRVVTNRSEYRQNGDTSVVIQTKITESYDGSKKF